MFNSGTVGSFAIQFSPASLHATAATKLQLFPKRKFWPEVR